MNLPKVILIHGNGGATADLNWFPWVKQELEQLGLQVIAETMPDNVLAREKYWLPFLEDELKADENTILVGHSSGAIAATRYAENNRIYGSVLVGTYHTDLDDDDEKQSGYFDRPWQWEKIKANQNWIIQFNSIDDPYIPIEEARYVHEQLGTDYHEDTDQGHYGSDVQEMTEFSNLVEALKKKLSLA